MTKKAELQHDSALTPDQGSMVDQLSEAQVKEIDQALLSNASDDWCQVNRLVLTTMIELDNGRGLPNSYFAQRIAHLVQDGILESKGDQTDTQSGEVRLKNKNFDTKDAK